MKRIGRFRQKEIARKSVRKDRSEYGRFILSSLACIFSLLRYRREPSARHEMSLSVVHGVVESRTILLYGLLNGLSC